MVTVTVAWSAGESRNDDFRDGSAGSHGRNHRGFCRAPTYLSFLAPISKTELVNRSEKLLAMIEPAGGKQFLGPNDPELFIEFGAEEVLTAVPTRRRKISGPNPGAAGKPCE